MVANGTTARRSKKVVTNGPSATVAAASRAKGDAFSIGYYLHTGNFAGELYSLIKGCGDKLYVAYSIDV